MSWRSRAPSPAAAAAVGLLLLALAVVAGRWEGGRHAEAELGQMEETLRLVGQLDSGALSGYRALAGFDCLVYRREANPYALEVCIDGEGRVVETIDRRRPTRRIGSLREDPEASTLRVKRATVDRLLRRLGAPCCR